jgi:hypothetical protein
MVMAIAQVRIFLGMDIVILIAIAVVLDLDIVAVQYVEVTNYATVLLKHAKAVVAVF